MAFCKNCGAEIPEGSGFCTSCGTPLEQAQPDVNTDDAAPVFDAQYTQYTEPQGDYIDPQDAQDNKVLSILAYIGILFIVPLVAAPNSKFAKFHANQGLVLFITDLILGVIAIIPILGTIVSVIGYIATFIFAIIGIVNAAKGEAKELPLIGKYRIIK